MSNSDLKYVFFFGSIHPQKIADLLELPLKDVLDKCRPCTLKGYKMAFMGMSRRWDWSSIATLIKDPKHEIKSFAFPVNSEQLSIIDEYELDPVMLERRKVELVDCNGVSFKGEAYKISHHSKFEFPSEDYMESCAMTRMAYYYLQSTLPQDEKQLKETKIEIWNAGTNQKLGDYYISNIKYDPIIKEIINEKMIFT